MRTPLIRFGSRARRTGEAVGRCGAVRFVAVSALAALALAGASKTGAQAAERQTPSGLPVPRYVSLKFGEVNARAGPGDDYRPLWTYRARGLPLQVIAETADWRRVCDPEGGVAWVHQRTVDTRRMVMRVQPTPLPLRRRPDLKSGAATELAGRALASLETCREGWCQVSVGRAKGWAPQSALWGTSDLPQCRAKLAKAPR